MFESFKWRRSARDQTGSTVLLDELVQQLNLGGVPRSKLSEVTYFTCLKILAESLGKLPLKLLQRTPQGSIEEAHGHPLYDAMRYRPNPLATSTAFWSDVEYTRNHFGNCYCAIVGSGANTSLWRLPNDSVELWMDDAKKLSDRTKLWYICTDAKTGRRVKYPDDSVLHFRTGMSADGISGMAVQDILRTTLDASLAGQDTINKLFKSGFVAKAVLQYTGSLNDDLEKKFMEKLEAYATGQVDTARNLIPIPAGSRLEPLNIKMTDAQFMELKKYNALQIAAACGIKPQQINDYEKASYASAEAQQLAFYVDTQLYILKQYEEELGFKLLTPAERAAGLFFKFNFQSTLRVELQKQIESLSQGVQNGIYTPNEARALLDMPRLEGSDVLMVNGNMIPVTQAGQAYQRGKEGSG